MINYANRCFTYGKPVRRDTLPGDGLGNYADSVSKRIDEIQRKFNRVGLLKQYYSKAKKDKQKKFDYPIDQQGKIVNNLAVDRKELYEHV